MTIMNLKSIRLVAITSALGTAIAFAGCETGGQTGALAGAGIGALAGQVIGGNTAGTLIGAGVGAGVGYIIGNEDDKKKARQYSSTTQSSNYDHNQTGSLEGTSWRLVSIKPADELEKGAELTLRFNADSHVVTNVRYADGRTKTENERFRVVDNILIVNREDYLVNYTYRIEGRTMYLDCEKFKAVLAKQ